MTTSSPAGYPDRFTSVGSEGWGRWANVHRGPDGFCVRWIGTCGEDPEIIICPTVSDLFAVMRDLVPIIKGIATVMVQD